MAGLFRAAGDGLRPFLAVYGGLSGGVVSRGVRGGNVGFSTHHRGAVWVCTGA